MIAAELTGDVYRDRRSRVWVRTWQGWESASEPVVRKSIASIPGLVELVPAPAPVMADDPETARFEAEGRDGGQLIFGDVHGYVPAAVSGQELWLDIHDDLRWRSPEDAGEATELGWRRLWVATS